MIRVTPQALTPVDVDSLSKWMGRPEMGILLRCAVADLAVAESAAVEHLLRDPVSTLRGEVSTEAKLHIQKAARLKVFVQELENFRSRESETLITATAHIV